MVFDFLVVFNALVVVFLTIHLLLVKVDDCSTSVACGLASVAVAWGSVTVLAFGGGGSGLPSVGGGESDSPSVGGGGSGSLSVSGGRVSSLDDDGGVLNVISPLASTALSTGIS